MWTVTPQYLLLGTGALTLVQTDGAAQLANVVLRCVGVIP